MTTPYDAEWLEYDDDTRRVTMEPNLTHYYGREVQSVEAIDTGWMIVLEGGVKILCEDANYDVPDSLLVGRRLQTAVLDSTTTRLYFGTDDNPRSAVMNLNPLKYAISDLNYNDGVPFYPQSTQAETEVDFSSSVEGDRVVEGPSDEYLQTVSAPDPEYVPEASESAQEAHRDVEGTDEG